MHSKDSELSESVAAGIGAIAGAVVAGISTYGSVVIVMIPSSWRPFGPHWGEMLLTAIFPASGAAVVGTLAGGAGGLLWNSRQAAFMGAVIAASIVLLGIAVAKLEGEATVVELAWFGTAACAVGGLAGVAGAITARSWGQSGGKLFAPRFSVGELLALVLLLAVLFSYVGHRFQVAREEIPMESESMSE